jgi:lysozyme
MKIKNEASYACVKLIGELEGFSPTIYRCPTGYKTIGYGHVVQEFDPVFKELLGISVVPNNTVITEEIGLQILRKDIERFEAVINKKCPQLKQQEFDACVSFAFNMGGSAFNNSTLAKLINQDFMDEAAGQFARWVFGKDNSGVPVRLSGLVKRREIERLIFVSAIKAPKINKSIFTRAVTAEIEQLFASYASRLFMEKQIKIELEA